MLYDHDPGDEHIPGDPLPTPGMTPCSECKRPVSTGNRVHYPTATGTRPCPGSWGPR